MFEPKKRYTKVVHSIRDFINCCWKMARKRSQPNDRSTPLFSRMSDFCGNDRMGLVKKSDKRGNTLSLNEHCCCCCFCVFVRALLMSCKSVRALCLHYVSLFSIALTIWQYFASSSNSSPFPTPYTNTGTKTFIITYLANQLWIATN